MTENWSMLFKGNKTVNGYSCVKDDNNNIYVVGFSEGGTSLADASYIQIGETKYTRNTFSSATFIVKIHDNKVIWFKWLDSIFNVIGYSITIDKTNDFIYITGASIGNLSINNTEYTKVANSNVDGFIIKLSTDGNTSWFKWINGTENDYVYSCVVDSLNNVIIIGSSSSNLLTSLNTPNRKNTLNTATTATTTTQSRPVADLGSYILKLNGDGEQLWFKWIDGNNDDKGLSVVLDSQNNIYVGGNSLSSTINIDTNRYTRTNENKTIYLTKFKPDGINEWFNWISGSVNDNLSSLLCDKYDYIYLCGNSQSSNIIINSIGYSRKNSDIKILLPFIIKFSNNTVNWFKWIESKKDVIITTMQIDKQNNLYISGHTSAENISINDTVFNNESKNDNAFLGKLKYNGDLEWNTWIYNLDKLDNKIISISVGNIIIDNDFNIYLNLNSNSNFIYFNGEEISSTPSSVNMYTLLFKYNIKDIIFEKQKLFVYIVNNQFFMYSFYILLVCIIIYILWMFYIKSLN
jgi:hypothetical protein